jgi:hypothetical protein
VSGGQPDTDRQSSAMRALIAEGAHGERTRLNDWIARLQDTYGSRGAAVSARNALQKVREQLGYPPGDMPFANLTGDVSSDIDSVVVGWQPDDEFPVRVMTVDGADSTVATAYFRTAEARELIEALTLACTAAEQDELDRGKDRQTGAFETNPVAYLSIRDMDPGFPGCLLTERPDAFT